jgi:hypothetical protein
MLLTVANKIEERGFEAHTNIISIPLVKICESGKEFYSLDVYATQLSVSKRELHEEIAPDI